MKYLSSFFFFLICSSLTFGQNHFIGIKGGFTQTNAPTYENYLSRKGFLSGFSYDLTTKRKISFGAELLYEQRGFINKFYLYTGVGNKDYSSHSNYNYISLPIKIGFKSSNRFFVYGNVGTIPAILVNANYNTYLFKNQEYVGDTTISLLKNGRSVDLSLFTEIGCGFKINKNFSVVSSFRKQFTFLSFKLNNQSSSFQYSGINLSLGVKYNLNYNQNPDTIPKVKLHSREYISLGVNTTSYFQNNFFDYLRYKTKPTENIYNHQYISAYTSDTIAKYFDCSRLYYSPQLKFGIEINSEKNKKIIRIVEASYLQFSGNYSYSVFYRVTDSGSETFYSFFDTTKAKFFEKIVTVSYRMQPTYKFIFLSAGINANLNFLHIVKKKSEKESRSQGFPSVTTITFSKSDTTDNFHFINFPLQFGVGGIIKFKSIFLTPALYVTPFFKKRNYFYNISIGIAYKFR